ncbi:MAG: hypothetical protein LDLANPLL_01671 [Turneriella sp.]|nr:hypothetical protein [Turneriella sp.]
MVRISILLLGICSLLIVACTPKKPVEDQAYLDFAAQAMHDIVPEIMQTVKKLVGVNGYTPAVSFCSQFAGEFGKKKNAEWSIKAANTLHVNSFRFRRISDKNRNPENKPNAKEEAILKAWAKDGATPTLYREGNRVVTMHPIKISTPMCLGCHGDSSTLDKRAAVEIRRRYPKDSATRYKLGDLRGAFVTESGFLN